MKNAVFRYLPAVTKGLKGKGNVKSVRARKGRRRRHGVMAVLFDDLACLIISPFPSPSNACLCRMLELSPIRRSVPARVHHCVNPAKDREMALNKSVQGLLWPVPFLNPRVLKRLCYFNYNNFPIKQNF